MKDKFGRGVYEGTNNVARIVTLITKNVCVKCLVFPLHMLEVTGSHIGREGVAPNEVSCCCQCKQISSRRMN